MDDQPLQDSAEGRSGRRSTDPSNMRGPPSATDNLRRTSTERENPDRRNLNIASDDNMNDESFNFPTARSYSWGSQSDGEDRGGEGVNRSSGRRDTGRDQRKFDMTTPTLIDEFDIDEEEEMVSLQRARMRQEERGLFVKDESSLRRTPGASMYKSGLPSPDEQIQMHSPSLRRTPGAHDMHRSIMEEGANVSSNVVGGGVASHHQEQHQQQQQPEESAVLGFGLTLTSPVATGNRPTSRNIDQESWERASSVTPSRIDQSTAAGTVGQPNRPPRVPGSGARSMEQQHHQQQHQQQQHQQQRQGEFTFTPWTLSKGAQLESRPGTGACSPNTLRLTEDLGNLLFEEEDQQVLPGAAQQRPSDAGAAGHGQAQREFSAESWTSSYVFKSENVGDIPSRVPRSSMGRGRRGRNDTGSSSRRSRNDRPTQRNDGHGQHGHSQVASFLPYAQQPKPVRGMQPSSLGGNPFMPAGFDASNPSAYQGGTVSGSGSGSSSEQQQTPRFFNFGGAFAPPAKDSGVGFRPPVPAPQTSQPPGFSSNIFMGAPQREQYQVARASPGPNTGTTSGGFQSQSFQPLGASRDSPFQQTFPSSNPGYAAASPSPQYGYSVVPYPAPQKMQATATEFFPMTTSHAPPPPEPRSNVSHFQPPPQGWGGAPPPPAQYAPPATTQGTWPSSTTGWSGGEFSFGVHPAQSPAGFDSRIGVSPAPPLASSSWTEREAEFSPHTPSPNIFVAAPPAHLEASRHLVPVSASPVFTSGVAPHQSRRDQQSGQGQQQSRQQKFNRVKGQTRRGSKQNKADKKEAGAPTQSQSRKSTPVNTGTSTGSGGGTKKKKHGRGRDSKTPEVTGAASVCSTPSNAPTPANVPSGDEGALVVEDPADAKKAELIESPATRSAFKDFYRRFRSEERTSFQGAEDFAIQSLGNGSLPDKVHWRVYLELADLAKRSNRFADARRLYQQVCRLQPFASQGWLEYSKLEEECGHLSRGARILRAGLEYCEYSENLLTRAIKHEEKMGNISKARELLARLKHVGIEKVWRTVLEGALLEARAGNVVMARRVLKYLMHHVPWYGPLYLEAYRLERDLGRTSEALQVVERGLAAIPRYGPLWFGAFRLCEEIDTVSRDFDLPRTMAMIDRATLSISKELIWKVHLDAAQMLERAALDQHAFMEETEGADAEFPVVGLANCRNRFAMTILNCPPNLRWKVWLAAGRMEIAVGNTERARRLFLRAHKVVPEKGRATTLLECARLEEFTGDFELARAILCRSRVEYGTDWKVWLESVLLEIRGGDHARSIDLAKGALGIHPGTGRLWAALVQLRYFEGGEEAQFGSLKQALNAVPKSGEVWCEGGRIHLNPFSRTFNLERARRHLFFATKFTPQYGDSFLESLRLELLEQWVSPVAALVWEASKQHILDADASDFNDQLENYMHELFDWLVTVCREDLAEEEDPSSGSVLGGLLDGDLWHQVRELLTPTHRMATLSLADLELRCANADPNYGLLWFHCRHGPTDTARRILSRATEKVMTDLCKFVPFYVAAIVRFSAITSMTVLEKGEGGDDAKAALPSKDDGEDAAWEDLIDARLLSAPSLYSILRSVDKEKGVVFLENTIAESTFATGLAELNKYQPLGELSLNERRKALFGTDALFS